MSADNYALVGIHPLAGTDKYPSTLHGVYVGFMSSDYRPSAIPESSKAFYTHKQAAAYADELETEYGVSFLCSCTDEDEKHPVAEREKELLYPATKRTIRQIIQEYSIRQVIQEYSDILNDIYEAKTAGDFTWKGILYEFLEELASAEDE